MIERIWDDERLRRAYRDRYGRPAPAGFAEAVAVATRTGRRPPGRWPALAALAATLAIAIGLGAASLAPRPRDDTSRQFAHRLPILTVAEALAVRARTRDSGEIAVAGFLSLPDPGIRCPLLVSMSINPVRLECPDTFGWLLETEEPLDAIRNSLPPGRIGFQPLFPGLDIAELRAVEGPELPDVVLIGHFRDRRGQGALCDAVEVGACGGFVASAVASIGGRALPASTVIDLEPLAPEPDRAPVWTPDDVKRRVVAAIPDLDVLSLLALPGHRIFELEPALGTGALGIIDRPIAWLVNGLQPNSSRVPRLRTFLLVDGDPDVAYEASSAARIGFVAIDLGSPPAVAPSSSPPSETVSFPTQVHDLEVISVTEALAQLQTARQTLDRDDTELAVRGFYIHPPESIACTLPRQDIEPLPPIDRSCPDGLTWLLEQPERPWDLVDGAARWHKPTGPALNPIVSPSVPFELPRLFRDTSGAEPLPVVVLGHFFDARARTEREAEQFVVDALVWRMGEESGDQTVVLGTQPVEQRAAVEARVVDALGPSRATWAAVMEGSALIGLDLPLGKELLDADAVWQLSRLVEEFGRPVVRIAYTVDGGSRIWGPAGLAPERRVEILATAGSTVVDMIDEPGVVIAAREVPAEDPDQASPRVFTVGVAVPVAVSNPPGRPSELRLRWSGTDCDERWTILLAGDGRSMDLIPTRRSDCQAVGVEIDIVLTFSGPVPADQVMIGGFGAGG